MDESSCLRKMKKKKKIETLMQTIKMYSQDVGMGFGIEKCAMLMMKNRKRQIT